MREPFSRAGALEREIISEVAAHLVVRLSKTFGASKARALRCALLRRRPRHPCGVLSAKALVLVPHIAGAHRPLRARVFSMQGPHR